jgi:hypothetical protein
VALVAPVRALVVHAPQEDGQLAQLALALMGSRCVALKPALMSCVQHALASVRRLAPPKRVRLTQLGQGRGRRRREILRDALAQRELARRLLGKKQLVKRALRKRALRREVLSAAPVEAAKTQVRRVALRAVALKLAQARDIADRAVAGKLVMLRAALRGGRLLAQAKPVMLSAAPVEAAKTRVRRVVLRATLAKATLARRAAVRAALVNPALVRAAVARDAVGKVLLHAPTPLALPGALGLVGSSKIRVNRRKAPPVNAALMRLVRVPRARNRRHPNGVVHPLIALRSRRASQWTRHLKPP